MTRTMRYLGLAGAGGILLQSEGCDVSGAILQTIELALRIVQVWV